MAQRVAIEFAQVRAVWAAFVVLSSGSILTLFRYLCLTVPSQRESAAQQRATAGTGSRSAPTDVKSLTGNFAQRWVFVGFVERL